MRILRRDREYWDEKGGPGFSGGELDGSKRVFV